MDFDKALTLILKLEGGYVNDPADRGGATNFGVTQKNYDKWRTDNDLDPREVKLISEDEVRTIYQVRYWQMSKADEMPWPVSLVHFDSYVQHRPRVASEILQRATNFVARDQLRVDGIIGPLTIETARRQDPKMLARSIIIERLFFYCRIVERDRTQAKFLKLWRPRMQRVLKVVLA